MAERKSNIPAEYNDRWHFIDNTGWPSPGLIVAEQLKKKLLPIYIKRGKRKNSQRSVDAYMDPEASGVYRTVLGTDEFQAINKAVNAQGIDLNIFAGHAPTIPANMENCRWDEDTKRNIEAYHWMFVCAGLGRVLEADYNKSFYMYATRELVTAFAETSIEKVMESARVELDKAKGKVLKLFENPQTGITDHIAIMTDKGLAALLGAEVDRFLIDGAQIPLADSNSGYDIVSDPLKLSVSGMRVVPLPK